MLNLSGSEWTTRSAKRGFLVIGCKVLLQFLLVSLIAAAFPLTTGSMPAARADTDYTAYVNPFIGTGNNGGGPGQSYPGEAQPFGMMQWSPDTTSDGQSSYFDGYSSLFGFTLLHWTGYGGHYAYFMPFAGSVSTSPGSSPSSYYNLVSNRAVNEQATAGYYQLRTDSGINVQLTGTTRAGYGLFTYPTSSPATMIINLNSDLGGFGSNSATLDPGNQTISGVQSSGTYQIYFFAKFDHAFSTYGTFNGSNVNSSSTDSGTGANAGTYVSFDTSSNPTVGVRVGISFVSLANAQANLNAEIPDGTSFSTVKTNSHDSWNNYLSRFAVSDSQAQSDDLIKFYSHVYFFLTQPNIISDINGEYWGGDNVKHTVASGHNEYSSFSSFDNARSFFQLLALMFQSVANDTIQSYLDFGNQTGRLASQQFIFRPNGADQNFSLPEYAMPAEAYAFGAHGFNTTDALNLLWNTYAVSGKGRNSGCFGQYVNLGYGSDNCFHPWEDTLNFAVSDFATSQFAQALGDQPKAVTLLSRSGNWLNTYDANVVDNNITGYAWNRNPDGNFQSWTSSTDGTGSSTRRTAEEDCSAEISYLVPQNIAGLISAMGGNSAFISRLDHLFSQFSNDTYGGSSDCQYFTANNEPDMQVPWLYNWAGVPSKTQDAVRRIITQIYQNTPAGIPGNNDWGTLSAWYVEASIGLYPEIPGVSGLAINSPLFASVTLTLENGHTITINGTNASRTNEYIQSATLNGASYDSPWLPLSALVNSNNNNTLSFVLGSSASDWGSNPTANQPPSYPSNLATNIAPGKTASANGQCEDSQGPGAAIDRSPSTKWCASFTSGAAWLKVDLGQSYNLFGLAVTHAGNENSNSITKDYKIQWSADGSDGGTWTDLVSVSGNTQNVVTSTPATPQAARWVRLYITAGQQDNGTVARIYEFQIYGSLNVALNKSVNSNASACQPSEAPQYAVDGSLTTKWCGYGGTAWLKLDLGQNYNLSGFVLKNAGYGGESAAYNTRDFKIQFSNDGNDNGPWTDLASVNANAQNVVSGGLPSTNTRYVRLYVTAGQQDGSQVERIYEFEVYTS